MFTAENKSRKSMFHSYYLEGQWDVVNTKDFFSIAHLNNKSLQFWKGQDTRTLQENTYCIDYRLFSVTIKYTMTIMYIVNVIELHQSHICHAILIDQLDQVERNIYTTKTGLRIPVIGNWQISLN